LEARQISAPGCRLAGTAAAEIELQETVLVIRRIHGADEAEVGDTAAMRFAARFRASLKRFHRRKMNLNDAMEWRRALRGL
jgi:hypothetical protein